MKYDFTNKIVLVTGGTGALGRTVSDAFISCGAKVVSSCFSDRDIEDLGKESRSALELIKADVTKEQEVEKVISSIISRYGRIHVLVNVVGGYLGGKSASELDEKEWDLMMNLNLKSAFLISKHVVRQMVSSQYGKIMHVSSRTGLKSSGFDSAYAASKSGLIRLVESLSEEVKESNINVNCIMPSVIDTEANRRAMPTADSSKWLKPRDLANVVLFLCSDEANVITGAAIPTYGMA
ncbi:MAG TPA: SDR family NAD(P)-dependent oxidoreductase [Candidatus Nitrosopolaris sp.]|nr:SDR family NAD(P)-dependent oxidoreductase [Candidatus Nitrosopolaris sp.]